MTQRPTQLEQVRSPEPLRTYKLRRGRITDGQRRALEALWPRYGIDLAVTFDHGRAFGRVAPLILDVGFGMGETTVAMAIDDPGRDVLAVDVHTPGAGALLSAVETHHLRNVRVMVADVRDVLAEMIMPGSLDEIRVFFPDPWPKVKHRKRRLIDASFVNSAAIALRPGGILHCATDWVSYADSIHDRIAREPLFTGLRACSQRPARRPATRFEEHGLAKGHQISDITCQRVGQAPASSPLADDRDAAGDHLDG